MLPPTQLLLVTITGSKFYFTTFSTITISIPQVAQSPSLPTRDASPEELIRSTKAITLATAKAVAAGNSLNQDDVVAAANMSRKAVTEMLIICKVIQREVKNN